MKSTLTWLSAALAIQAWAAYADNQSPKILELPEFCGATQIGVQTIVNCAQESDLPKLDYEATWDISAHVTWDTVDMILQWMPFFIQDWDAIMLDADWNGTNDTEIGIQDWEAYIKTNWSYGTINEQFDCIASTGFDWRTLVCKAWVQVPLYPYNCITGLNDQWTLILGGNSTEVFKEENYSLCIDESESL